MTVATLAETAAHLARLLALKAEHEKGGRAMMTPASVTASQANPLQSLECDVVTVSA